MAMLGQFVTTGQDRDPYLTERYTRASEEAIHHAQEEAQRRGETVIDVSDLLAGLSLDEDTRAERVGSLKANAFYLRWLVGLPPLPSQFPSVGAGFQSAQFKLSQEAQRALLFAVAEADRDREYWIDSDHLLRGLLRFPNKADFALLKTEVTLSEARSRSRRDREEHIPEENPNLKVVQYLIRKHLAFWLPPVLGLACYLYILIQGLSPMVR